MALGVQEPVALLGENWQGLRRAGILSKTAHKEHTGDSAGLEQIPLRLKGPQNPLGSAPCPSGEGKSCEHGHGFSVGWEEAAV